MGYTIGPRQPDQTDRQILWRETWRFLTRAIILRLRGTFQKQKQPEQCFRGTAIQVFERRSRAGEFLRSCRITYIRFLVDVVHDLIEESWLVLLHSAQALV